MTTKAGWAWKASEQLQRILGSLISSGSLQERLTRAAPEISILQQDMMPEEHRATFARIEQSLTATPPSGGEGAYAAAIAAMSEEERRRIAGELVELWFQCERTWRDE